MEVDFLHRPSIKDLALELTRARKSYNASTNTHDDLLGMFPSGDPDTPVLLVPGFTAHDILVKPLGEFVSDLGYSAKKWKGGVHLGPSDYCREHFAERFNYIHEKHGGQPVTIIGWSLGGIMARELAREFPEKTSQVITLGSPHLASDHPRSTFLRKPVEYATYLDQKIGDGVENTKNLFRLGLHVLFNKTNLKEKAGLAESWTISSVGRLLKMPEALIDDHLAQQAKFPIGVPCTHIYTKRDGFVNWQTCIGEENKITQNVEVDTSHIGLVYDFQVRLIIADRLTMNANRGNNPWLRFNTDKYDDLLVSPSY